MARRGAVVFFVDSLPRDTPAPVFDRLTGGQTGSKSPALRQPRADFHAIGSRAFGKLAERGDLIRYGMTAANFLRKLRFSVLARL